MTCILYENPHSVVQYGLLVIDGNTHFTVSKTTEDYYLEVQLFGTDKFIPIAKVDVNKAEALLQWLADNLYTHTVLRIPEEFLES